MQLCHGDSRALLYQTATRATPLAIAWVHKKENRTRTHVLHAPFDLHPQLFLPPVPTHNS